MTFLLGGVLIFEWCSEVYLYLFLFSTLDTFISCTWVLWPLLTYIVLIFFIYWCMFLSPTLTCIVSFLSLCTCFIFLYAIYYFCFTLRCRNEFFLKCFRNTGCQSLFAINSLLAKFFKSLCYDRFYCIQQVNMSYDISYMFICLL